MTNNNNKPHKLLGGVLKWALPLVALAAAMQHQSLRHLMVQCPSTTTTSKPPQEGRPEHRVGVLMYPTFRLSNNNRTQNHTNDSNDENEYLDYTDLKTHPLTLVNCAVNGKLPILLHKTGIDQWVCDYHGEQRVTEVMLHIFSKHQQQRQQTANKKNLVMLDIGANTGYYGLLAAVWFQHQVIQFDLQPTCLRMLRNAVIANGVADRVVTVAAGVSHAPGHIPVSDVGCDGRFPASARERQVLHKLPMNVPLYPLSHFLHMDDDNTIITMIKVDTEGNEQRVLHGALDLFARHQIRNAVVEVTPGANFWKNAGITREQVVDVFGNASAHGYVLVSLEDYSIWRNVSQVRHYIATAEFTQSDVWLTLEPEILESNATVLDPKVALPVYGL